MKRSNPGSAFFCLLALGLGAALAGCQPANPLDRTISASTPIRYDMWRSDTGSDLTTEQWQSFDLATQELKFQLTVNHVAEGTDGVNEAFRSEIDGKSIRDVITQGLQAKLTRRKEERDDTARMLAENTTIATEGEDPDAVAGLHALRERQAARLEAAQVEIKSLEARLREFTPTPPATSP